LIFIFASLRINLHQARRKSSVKGKRKSSVANATEKNISPGSKENDGPLSAEKKKTPSSGRKTSLGLSVANNSGATGESTLKSAERRSVGKSPKQRSPSVGEWSTPNGTGRKTLANESKSSENIVMSASRGTAAKSASRKRISSVASTAKELYQDIPSELPTIGMSGKSLTPARRFLLAKQVEEFSVSRRSLKKDLQRTPQSAKSAQKKRRSSAAKKRISSGAVAPAESDDQSPRVTKTPPSSAGKGSSAQKTSTGKKLSARKSKTPSSASQVKTPRSASKDAVDISGSAGKVKTPLSSGKEKSASKLTPSRSASTDDKVATPRMPTPRARLLDTPSPKVASRKGTPVASASKSNAKTSTSGEGKRGSTARQGRRPQSVGGKANSKNVAAERRAKSLSPATARKMAVVSVASLKADAAARVVVKGRKSTDRVASPMPSAAKASPASASGKAMSPHDHSDSSFSAKSPAELKKQLAELRRRSQLVPEDEEATVPETPSSASRVKETGSGKKRKSGDTFAVPMSKRDKRVSFGPNLSPEQYALWLPASAPLKRGSTPQHSGTPRPPPKRQQQQVIEEDEDAVNSQLPVMLQQLASTTPKPQTPRIVSLTPTARSTATTPVQRIVMSGGKVVPSSASKLPVSLSLTKVPLSSVKSPVIAFVVKKTPVREMTVVTSPSSSAANKTPRTGTPGTVDKVTWCIYCTCFELLIRLYLTCNYNNNDYNSQVSGCEVLCCMFAARVPR
jgi:hypothetical protein